MSTPFSAMASAEKAPAVRFHCSARAVPMPCDATPIARPFFSLLPRCRSPATSISVAGRLSAAGGNGQDAGRPSPSGLALNSGTGTIAGTPTTNGTYEVPRAYVGPFNRISLTVGNAVATVGRPYAMAASIELPSGSATEGKRKTSSAR